jgi:hypothetical protein
MIAPKIDPQWIAETVSRARLILASNQKSFAASKRGENGDDVADAAWRRLYPQLSGYLQPASRSHSLRSLTWVFSQEVIDWVSFSLILLFMQVQYLSTTSRDAPSSLLSLRHRLIHLTSSVVAAKATLAVKPMAASAIAKAANFMRSLLRVGLLFSGEILV